MMYIYWLRNANNPNEVIDYYADHLYEIGSEVFAFDKWWIVEDYAPNHNIAAWEDSDDFWDDGRDYAEAWYDEDEF